MAAHAWRQCMAQYPPAAALFTFRCPKHSSVDESTHGMSYLRSTTPPTLIIMSGVLDFTIIDAIMPGTIRRHSVSQPFWCRRISVPRLAPTSSIRSVEFLARQGCPRLAQWSTANLPRSSMVVDPRRRDRCALDRPSGVTRACRKRTTVVVQKAAIEESRCAKPNLCRARARRVVRPGALNGTGRQSSKDAYPRPGGPSYGTADAEGRRRCGYPHARTTAARLCAHRRGRILRARAGVFRAAGLGKIPTTFDRRLISLLSRSSGFVLCSGR